MGCFKRNLAIFLALQICSLALAQFYANPDAETINTDGSYSSRDQYIIEAAIRRGMDGEAVTELLRTKQPVVKVKVEPNGATKTTTYKLDSDGSISSNTVTEVKSVRHFTSGDLPESVALDDILNSPSGTVTKTFTDKDGAKVTRTFSVSKPKTSLTFDSDNSDDWFRRGFPSWSSNPDSSSNVHRTWPSKPDDETPTNLHKVTKTYVGPNGEKRVVETWSSDPQGTQKDDTFPSSKWPSFGFPDFSQHWQPTDNLGGSSEWTVVNGNPDVETSTNHKFPSWTPKGWNYPKIPSFETTTSTTTEVPSLVPKVKVTTPLPSLEDFLKHQYTPPTKITPTTTKTATTTARPRTNPTIASTKKPFEVPQIFINGYSANESIAELPHLTPKLNTGNVLKIENKHPIVTEDTPQKVESNVRKITKTVTGSSKPTLNDLDPQMREILKNAGITPEDITNIEGDTITKTRTEPDGRVVKTTYKVRSSPAVATTYEETKPTRVFSTSEHFRPVEIPNILPHAGTSTYNKSGPIAEFLAKLGLTKSDILSNHGEYTRTIIEDDGQVLTATFVLSNPINAGKVSPPVEAKKPLK